MEKIVESIVKKLDEEFSEIGISKDQDYPMGLNAYPMGLTKPEKEGMRSKDEVADTTAETGVLMAIDDISRALNQYDAVARRLNTEGKPEEAKEVKDMANMERKNKVRLREILKDLGSD